MKRLLFFVVSICLFVSRSTFAQTEPSPNLPSPARDGLTLILFSSNLSKAPRLSPRRQRSTDKPNQRQPRTRPSLPLPVLALQAVSV
jgi:hypothetical protein